MRWSLARPFAVGLRSARATPAPPVVMAGYSARLAMATSVTGLILSGLAQLHDARYSPVAVWHAMLNATGGLFFFAMVVGDDRARLGLLLSSAYNVLAVAVHFAGGRHLVWRDDLAHPEERAPTSEEPEGEPAPHLLR